MSEPTPFDAVILAGGTGSRLGGASKADLELDGQRLLDRQRTHPFVVLSLDKAGRSSFDPDEIDRNAFFSPDAAVVPRLEAYMDALRKAGFGK